ncbi:hypothetical protein cypCar_00042000 [Cyprinus carpio]|nr:hypothetical protein cypCar_00042000 [Cyprinus carpio]
MSFIEKSVARLDQLEQLETLAQELGKSHFRYNAPPKYYGTLFQYVTAIMKDAYLEEERSKRSQTLPSSRERPDKRNTAI